MHSLTEIVDTFSRLNAERTAGIRSLEKANPEWDYTTAAVEWDFNHAPIGTNAKMLDLIGIDCSTAGLEEIITGLFLWNIRLSWTKTLTTEQVLRVLREKTLVDPIRMIAPSKDMTEFVFIEHPLPENDDELVSELESTISDIAKELTNN
jgi:hypothetical protein